MASMDEKELLEVDLGRIALEEFGTTGLKTFSGRIFEEFLPELGGTRAIKIYEEMRKNDAVIKTILFAISKLISQVDWPVIPASEDNEDKLRAEFLEQNMQDMSRTWQQTISEILTFLAFGWAYHEVVYKIRRGDTKDGRFRSKHNDGKWGWRKIPLRGQESLDRWILDPDGGIRGLRQFAIETEHAKPAIIPISKALLFRTSIEKKQPRR